MLLFEPYLYKPRTVARGNVWKAIAAQLTAAPFSFEVDARAVRERFGGLVERFKAINREELVSTGVSPGQSQLDVALEEIVQKMHEAELANETNENNANENRCKEMEYAKYLRKMACETLGETSKRKSEESGPAGKKRRSNGSDTLVYLREKGEKEQEMKKTEFDWRKQELELRRLEVESNREQNQQIMTQLMAQNQQLLLLLTNLYQNKEQ